MNVKNLLTGLGIAGGALGVIGGVMSIVQTADEMKNGVKLRKDQLDYIASATAVQVTNVFVDRAEAFARATANEVIKNLNAK